MRILKRKSGLALLASAILLPSICLAQAEGETQNVDTYLKEQKATGADVAQTSNEQPPQSTPEQKPSENTGKPYETAEEGAKTEPVKQDEATLARRVALAEEMHKIRSTKDQVDGAIKRAAKTLPANEREAFTAAMSTILNYRAIERISVDAMAETYTVEELEAMVEYYKKPEAITAAKKMRSWIEKVQPEIQRIIDKAMMQVRAGAPN